MLQFSERLYFETKSYNVELKSHETAVFCHCHSFTFKGNNMRKMYFLSPKSYLKICKIYDFKTKILHFRT